MLITDAEKSLEYRISSNKRPGHLLNSENVRCGVFLTKKSK